MVVHRRDVRRRQRFDGEEVGSRRDGADGRAGAPMPAAVIRQRSTTTSSSTRLVTVISSVAASASCVVGSTYHEPTWPSKWAKTTAASWPEGFGGSARGDGQRRRLAPALAGAVDELDDVGAGRDAPSEPGPAPRPAPQGPLVILVVVVETLRGGLVDDVLAVEPGLEYLHLVGGRSNIGHITTCPPGVGIEDDRPRRRLVVPAERLPQGLAGRDGQATMAATAAERRGRVSWWLRWSALPL